MERKHIEFSAQAFHVWHLCPTGWQGSPKEELL